jgi:hypothetical protein
MQQQCVDTDYEWEINYRGAFPRGGIPRASSSRIVSPISIPFSTMVIAEWASTSAIPSRLRWWTPDSSEISCPLL